jgi:hypothetical protein
MFEVPRRNPEAAAGVRPEWRRIVQSAEKLLGRSWDEMAHRHGDWRWDGTMAAATRPPGWRLVAGVREMGGLSYKTATQGIRRFWQRMEKRAGMHAFAQSLRMSIVNV